MLNLYSVQLLIVCQLLKSFGQIWTNLFCIDLGLFQIILSFQLCLLMLLPVIPLFIDVSNTFMQRVNPPQLFDLIKYKLEKIQKARDDFTIRQLRVWNLDKAFTIVELSIDNVKN